MKTVFMEILNMSVMAGIVACAVIIVRLPLKKAPKVFSYALWAVVMFRLLCPFKLESALSFLPASANTVPQSIIYTQAPVMPSNITHVENPVSTAEINQTPPSVESVNSDSDPMSLVITIAAYVWLAGMIALLGYAVFSYIRLKHRMKTAVLIRENIYETDRITTSFVLGFINPKIYLPVGMEDVDYILKHEQTHIRRLDHWIKPAAFLSLCLHWFNPVIWLSYYLCCKDMEMSCDESVLKHSGVDIRSRYSGSLLAVSEHKSGLLSPIAFGESNTKARIKNVLYYKKSSMWISVVAVVAVLAVTVGFAATRVQESQPWMDAPQRTDWSEDYMHINRIYLGSERDYVEARMGEPDYSDESIVHYIFPDSDYDVTIYYDDPTIIEKKGLRGVWRIDLIGGGEIAGVNGENAGTLAGVLERYGGPNKVERDGNVYTLWYYSPQDSDRRMWFEVENGELNRHMGIICVNEGKSIAANEAVELLIDSLRYTDNQISFQIPAQYYKPYDWNIHISGRAAFEDGMSMSVHEFEDVNDSHAWEAGKWYAISYEGRNLTELTMGIYLPDENGNVIDNSVDLLKALQNAYFDVLVRDRELSDAMDIAVDDQGDYGKTAAAWLNAWLESFKSMPADGLAHLEDGVVDSLTLLMTSKAGLPKAMIFSAEASVKPKYTIGRNSFWMAGNTGSSPGRDESWGQFYREFELRQESDGKFHLINSGTGAVWGPTRYDEYDLVDDSMGSDVQSSGFVYTNAGLTIKLPEDYRDKVTLLTANELGADAIIEAYHTVARNDYGGFMFRIVRHTPAEFEDYWPERDMVGGSRHFAMDKAYYYSVETPTDVQASPDDWEDYQALSGQIDTILASFISDNVVSAYDHYSAVYAPEYTYPGVHAIHKITLSNDAKFEVVLSKPIRQDNTGIWCVERMYDEYENLYIAMPETDMTASKFYAQLQAETDAGHRVGLLDAEDVALTYLENVWDYARHIKESSIEYSN